MIARLTALLIVTAATLAVAWVVYQDNHGDAMWVLLIGGACLVLPVLWSIVDGGSDE